MAVTDMLQPSSRRCAWVASDKATPGNRVEKSQIVLSIAHVVGVVVGLAVTSTGRCDGVEVGLEVTAGALEGLGVSGIGPVGEDVDPPLGELEPGLAVGQPVS